MGKLMGVIQYSGKLGTTVGYKGSGGRQNVRVHVDTIKNPKTPGQLVQRMICATVGVGVSYLTEILNNAFEGKSFGAESLAYARKLWMNMLRTSNAASLNSTHKYLPKGQKQFICNPYQLSEGRLGAPTPFGIAFQDYNFKIANGNSLDATSEPNEVFPNIEVGHQITIVMIGFDGNSVTPGNPGGDIVKYCRFAFVNPNGSALVAAGNQFRLNSANIDLTKAEGPWDQLRFEQDGDSNLVVDCSNVADWEEMDAVGIIVSDKENNRRSRSFLVVSEDYDSDSHFSGGEVYPTYGQTGTEVDFPSDWYLQNSTRPSNGE